MKKYLILLFLVFIYSQHLYSMAGILRPGVKEAAEVGGEAVINTVKKSDSGFFDSILGLFQFPNPVAAISHSALRVSARKISERIIETKEKYPSESKEISSWKTPEGEFTENEKLAYQLSCVVFIETPTQDIGSGFYINENTIITNYHVIQDHNNVKIEGYLNDKTIAAKVIARDKKNDLAALRTYKEKHKHCTPEKKFNPPILSEVIAVGHPDGIKFRVTKGEISAYRDNKLEIVDPNNLSKIQLIDMSADIYFGSSGGPLFYKGKVLGVNTSIIEKSNINFAIHFRVLNDFISKNNL